MGRSEGVFGRDRSRDNPPYSGRASKIDGEWTSETLFFRVMRSFPVMDADRHEVLMMRVSRRCFAAGLFVLSMAVMSGTVASQNVAGEATDEVDKPRREAREKLKADLATLKGAKGGQLLDIKEPVLAKSFKHSYFFVLRFRLYPVAIVPQPPLKTNNVFVVSDAELTHITDAKMLEEFFKKNLPAEVSGKAEVVDTTRSWLRLAQELHKDGFFEFEKPSVEVSDTASDGFASEGVVEVVPKRGDKGNLTVRMEFVSGKLRSVKAGGKVLLGIRPKCQAMRLLDEDPVIREIMRRDILVMGRACKSYLDEVRANASPELQRAIDEVWQQILDESR